MPRKKRSISPPTCDDYDDDFDDEISSNGSRNHLQPPIQRNAANARERARMRVLSSAFCRLKTKLPWVPADTKLSKLDTLRLAKIYIEQLRARLAGEEGETLHPQNLIWLGFQQHVDIGHNTSSSTLSSSSSSSSSTHINQSQWLSSSSTSSSRDSSDLYNTNINNSKQSAINSIRHTTINNQFNNSLNGHG